MAFVHGRDTTFSLDNSGGSPTDLTAYFNTSGLQRAIDTHETTVYGLDDKTYIPGLKGATIPIGGPWDATLDAHMEGVLQNASLTFAYVPGGGGVTYSGECIITRYEINSPVDDVVTWSGELLITGAVGRA